MFIFLKLDIAGLRKESAKLFKKGKSRETLRN